MRKFKLCYIISKDFIEESAEEGDDLTNEDYYTDLYLSSMDYVDTYVLDLDNRTAIYMGDTGHNTMGDKIAGFREGLEACGLKDMYEFSKDVEMTEEKLEEWKNKIFDFE